ncbi:hypothetical protein FQR65_LT01826 [Abscondita terminalis]|nr:hypothetical protein FQR65_LT01826 [Abscondita terminalis]
MKIIVAVVAFFCMGVNNAHSKDEDIENCFSSTGVDKNSVLEFMKASTDNCEGIEAYLKCIAEAKGILQNGAVNVSGFEKHIKDNVDAQKQLSSCRGVDRKLLADFLQGSKDCEGIEACLKCIVEVEGIVQNGAVNVSSLEKLGRGNADAEKQLTVCQGMSADDFCGLSKCLRSLYT